MATNAFKDFNKQMADATIVAQAHAQRMKVLKKYKTPNKKVDFYTKLCKINYRGNNEQIENYIENFETEKKQQDIKLNNELHEAKKSLIEEIKKSKSNIKANKDVVIEIPKEILDEVQKEILDEVSKKDDKTNNYLIVEYLVNQSYHMHKGKIYKFINWLFDTNPDNSTHHPYDFLDDYKVADATAASAPTDAATVAPAAATANEMGGGKRRKTRHRRNPKKKAKKTHKKKRKSRKKSRRRRR